jgi:DNA-binding Lrp family transcriptional regulator
MKQYSEDLDEQDLIILRELQAGIASNAELARRVNLSAPATHARVRRLEQLGFMRGNVTVLNRERLGFDLLCFITVSLQMHKPEELRKFLLAMQNAPEVLECHQVTGDYDYILKVALRGRSDLQRFLMDVMTPIPAVARLTTRVVLSELKSTTELPI